MQAEMPIVDYNTCAKGNEKLGEVVDSLMVCAGYGRDSKVSGCHGDSGGPLVCEDKKTGRWTLRGTVSWGDHHCNGGPTYSVFVRMNSYIDWIKCKMISEPLQPSKLQFVHKANPAYFLLLIDEGELDWPEVRALSRFPSICRVRFLGLAVCCVCWFSAQSERFFSGTPVFPSPKNQHLI